jgi:hypothetical protein
MEKDISLREKGGWFDNEKRTFPLKLDGGRELFLRGLVGGRSGFWSAV